LYLDDQQAEYHYQFARALLKAHTPPDPLTMHNATVHLQIAMQFQPEFPEVLVLAREYNLIE